MFAVVGIVVTYFAIGAFIGWIVSSCIKNRCEVDEELLVIFSVIFWPAAIVVGLVYLVVMWLAFPFIAATREYVDNAVNRTNRRIDRECSTYVDVGNDLDIFNKKAPFKEGDVITGIVPQTDEDGEVISYKHLYQGCKCRVLRIDNNGSMKVILIGHKDMNAHASYIGETFTAPARNFTKVKNIAKKSKVVKKVARKKAKR